MTLFLFFWLILGLVGAIGLCKTLDIPFSNFNIALIILGTLLLGDVLFIVFLAVFGLKYIEQNWKSWFTKK